MNINVIEFVFSPFGFDLVVIHPLVGEMVKDHHHPATHSSSLDIATHLITT